MSANPVPAALAKRGITGMVDNLPPGVGLDIAREFVRLFGPELKTLLRAEPPRTPAGADCREARP